MAIQHLTWQVDGEFITNLARTWFWEENKPYATCEELLLSCLCTDQITLDEKKEIAQDIIEGRKKLVGINTFTLEHDGENIRLIADKLESTKRKLKIAELQNNMTNNMINFVDPFSTIKSIEGANLYNVVSLEQCQTWFWYRDIGIQTRYLRPYEPGSDMFDVEGDDTQLGLWLYDYPEVAYDAMVHTDAHPGNEYEKDEFWAEVYTIIKNNPKFQSISFKRRNENYLAHLRMKQEKKVREQKLYPYTHGMKPEENNHPTQNAGKIVIPELAQKTIDLTTEYLNNHTKPEKDSVNTVEIIKYNTMSMINHTLTNNTHFDTHDRTYYLTPDDYEKWEGLIAPNGDFYSCDFGGHNAKAYHLICAFPEKFPTINYDDLELHSSVFNASNALDTLLEQGWCATRYLPTMGSYIQLPTKNDIPGNVTKAQSNAIFDAKIKHDISVDLSPIGF